MVSEAFSSELRGHIVHDIDHDQSNDGSFQLGRVHYEVFSFNAIAFGKTKKALLSPSPNALRPHPRLYQSPQLQLSRKSDLP